MKSPTYIIPGEPLPQPRARVTRHGFAFDPRAKHKEQVRALLSTQRTHPIITTPISISATFFMPIPTSLSKKKQSLLQGQPHCHKPDIDNLLKLILDCCSKILILDDNLVFSVNCKKIYDLKSHTEFHFIYGAENEEKVNP